MRHYLEHVHFTIITDHWSLKWLNQLKDLAGRLARWPLRLQPFSYTIIHKKGKEHVVPDFISRSVKDTELKDPKIDTVQAENTIKDKWYLAMIRKVGENPIRYKLWRVKNNTLFKNVRNNRSLFPHNHEHWKIVVSKERRTELLQENHDSPTAGHSGAYKTYWRIHNKFYWPKMKADVNRYVRNCRMCGECKVERKSPAGLMGAKPVPVCSWKVVSIDLVGPFPRTPRGHTKLLVALDTFSKFVLLFPLRSATAKAISDHIENDVFLVYGMPEYLISHNGVQMRRKEFKKLCATYKVNLSYTPLYYPRADPTERVNRVVKTMSSAYVKQNHRVWDQYLAAVGCAIRTQKHGITGFSPFYINFGREHVLKRSDFKNKNFEDSEDSQDDTRRKRQEKFKNMYSDVKKKLERAQQRNAHQYNLRRRPVKFQQGQKVWRRNKIQSDALNYINAKVAHKYIGPFAIKKKLGMWTYELQDEEDI